MNESAANAQLGEMFLKAIFYGTMIIIFIVMANNIGRIRRILERIEKRDKKPLLILLFSILSLSAYSQCKINLPPGTTYQFCGSQTIISAPIKDSSIYHYYWFYREYVNSVHYDSPAPYTTHSFIMTKAGYDSLMVINKKTCAGCIPWIMLKITSDSTGSCPSGLSSNDASINISHIIPKIETPSICLITVDSLNHNRLVIAKPTVSPDSIVIQKLSGANWKNAQTIKRNDLLEFTDANSNASSQTYSYRLISYLYDSCYAETVASASSVVHTSILLQVSPNPTGGFNLSWSKYIGLSDAELTGYYIYRGSSYSSLHIIDTTQSLQNTAFNDSYSENAEYFYVVEAIKLGGCETGQHLKKELSVRSNTAKRKVNGIERFNPKPVIRLENSVLYSDKPISVSIVNEIGKLTYTGKSSGVLPLSLSKGLNIIVVNNGEATLKTVRQ